ncbi:hypothetical protein ACLKA7_017654 [Drosophila subpalustris]
MRLRRRLRKRYKRTRRHDHWIEWQRVSRKLSRIVQSRREEYFNYILHNADPQKKGNFNLWRATKALKQQPHIQYTLKNHNGQWCQTVEEQAEAFAIDLERRFRPFDTASAAHCRRVESLLDRQIDLPDSTRNHHHLRHVTLEELKSYIDQLLMYGGLPDYWLSGDLCFCIVIIRWISSSPVFRHHLHDTTSSSSSLPANK